LEGGEVEKGRKCKLISVCREDEIVHVLKNLKQRFSTSQEGKPLVYRVECEIRERFIPKRNKTIHELRRGEAYAKIANDSYAEFSRIAFPIHEILNFDAYSEFQFYGWGYVYTTLLKNQGLILSAPTGSGKTETFIPPLIIKLIEDFKNQIDSMYLLVYPRTALLKEQVQRIFKYVYNAKQRLRPEKDIVIGLQFAGIASDIERTQRNTDIFKNRNKFLLFKCPVCRDGDLIFNRTRRKHVLKCEGCEAEWLVSLAKNTHISLRPNILITTFESLDRLFMHPKFEDLFERIEGIFVDEVHLFHGIYGAHISNFIKNIEEVKGKEIAKIGISATISNPKEFGSKLFYKETNANDLDVLTSEEFEKEKSGCEYIYFIKAYHDENSSLEAATFIQAAMAIGHGILKGDEQALAFIDSVDLVKRFKGQLQDAEENKSLWKFRLLLDEIKYKNLSCPQSHPCNCDIYKYGECWRVINLKNKCYKPSSALKEDPLKVEEVSSQSGRSKWEEADFILSTPSLEVGIDKDTILATMHYRAPRSVFSFIQRRGRAGRKSDKAYTFLVLGNTSMDNFYFYKRHRLLDEKRYSLPLNPSNGIIEKMHFYLILQRQNLVEKYEEYGEKASQVIKDFTLNFFKTCSLLNTVYNKKIKELEDSNNFIDSFGRWIEEEKNNLEAFFNVEQIIKYMKDEVPEIKDLADELLSAIKNSDFDEVYNIQNKISVILVKKELDLIEKLGRNNEDLREFRETRENLERYLDKIQTINIKTTIIDRLENYYHFFKTLVDKLRGRDWLWKSNSIPDIVKTFLQASFYLHLNVDYKEDDGCEFKDVDFYIPDAYFQEVKPIIVEVKRGNFKLPDIVLEDSSMLEYILIPYKAIYRYSGDDFVNVVDSGKNEIDFIEKLGDHKYRITIPIRYEYFKGLDKGNNFEVNTISVKSLKTDNQGKQTLKICPECFTLHSYTKKLPCHNSPLENIRVDAKPVSKREIKVNLDTAERVGKFTLSKIEAKILVEGSDVNVFKTNIVNGNIIPTKNKLYQLEVRYEKPLSYTLISKGIIWKVDDELLDKLSSKERKILLHSGAHLLLKLVASLGGVHEQVLQYHFDVEKGEIYVWERYEGGIGVVDTVFSKIKENPLEVYTDLVNSVLCPIHLADRIKKEKIENVCEYLKRILLEEFYIGEDNELISELTNEVEKELKELKNGEYTCKDGCPVCIHINYCQDGFNQENVVSRKLTEKLVKALLRKINIEELNQGNMAKVLARINDKVIIVDI